MKFAWHVHHDRLIDVLTESIEWRLKYIREHKPANEVATRSRLLKPVEGFLPDDLIHAGHQLIQSYLACAKAYRDQCAERNILSRRLVKLHAFYVHAEFKLDRAYEVCNRVINAQSDAIKHLHGLECADCPWDGHTIFPQQKN